MSVLRSEVESTTVNFTGERERLWQCVEMGCLDSLGGNIEKIGIS